MLRTILPKTKVARIGKTSQATQNSGIFIPEFFLTLEFPPPK